MKATTNDESLSNNRATLRANPDPANNRVNVVRRKLKEKTKMQKTICNLSASDYGLKDHADSFKAAKEINAAVVDVLETTYMRPEDKWIAVYQVMKKYKHLNAINQRAFDAVERVFFLHSGEQNPALPCVDAMAKKDAEQTTRANLSLFIGACCGTVALVSAALIGEPMINMMIIAGSSFVLGGSVTVAVGSWFGKF